jgi:hypothetical protein
MPMPAAVGRPETTFPIIRGSTIEGTVAWTPFSLPLTGPESAYVPGQQLVQATERLVGDPLEDVGEP